MIANVELNLGDIFLMQSDLVLAQECLDRVYRLTHNPATSDWGKWRYSMYVFASLSELWLAQGDFGRARGFADRCLEVATRTKSRKYLAWGWRLAGDIARSRRHWDDAERGLGEAMTAAHAVGNPTQLWKTHLAVGRLAAARGRHDGARGAYSAARGVIERMKASLRDEHLRAAVERSLVFRPVYDLSDPA